MDPDQLEAEVSEKISRLMLADGAKYLLFIRKDDAISDCLIKFAKDNNLSAKIVDVTGKSSLYLSDEFLIQSIDLPCIYDPSEGCVVYTGCPKHGALIL